MSARVILGAWPRSQVGRSADEIVADVARCVVSRGDRAIRYQRKVFRFATCVLAASPRSAQYLDLDMALWGDDPRGGPEYIEKLKHIYAYRLRQSLPLLGIRLETLWGLGYRAHFDPLPAVAPVIPGSSFFRVLAVGANRPSEAHDRARIPVRRASSSIPARRPSIPSDRVGVRP